jgi:hypothetical protein
MDPRKPRNEIEIRFWELHALKPEIYDWVKDKANLLWRSGRRHYGIQALWEDARWETRLFTDNGNRKELFKINNDYDAYYARFYLQNHQLRWGLFELRRVRGEYPYWPPPRFDDRAQGLLL